MDLPKTNTGIIIILFIKVSKKTNIKFFNIPLNISFHYKKGSNWHKWPRAQILNFPIEILPKLEQIVYGENLSHIRKIFLEVSQRFY